MILLLFLFLRELLFKKRGRLYFMKFEEHAIIEIILLMCLFRFTQVCKVLLIERIFVFGRGVTFLYKIIMLLTKIVGFVLLF